MPKFDKSTSHVGGYYDILNEFYKRKMVHEG